MNIKIPFWASVFTIISLIILCSLGWWQVQRLQWKTNILSSVDSEFDRVKQGDVSLIDLSSAMRRDDFIISGALRGTYLHDKEVLIQSRVNDGVPGYHVVTPFVIDEDGRDAFILVNRGWIPLEAERDDGFSMSRPEGGIQISGMLVTPPDAQYQPDNDVGRGLWYRIDIGQLEGFTGINEFALKILYVGAEGGQSSEGYPVPVMEKLRSNIRNNHAQYAFFWFAMAFVLVGVYAFRFVLPQTK